MNLAHFFRCRSSDRPVLSLSAAGGAALRAARLGLSGLALGTVALAAPSITATKDDGVAPGVRKLQGDTIDYTITIANGAAATVANGVTLTDPTPANTTLVPGSVHASPLAMADSYTAVGNTKLYVGTAAPAGEPAVVVAAGSALFANDVAITDSLVYVSHTAPAHGTLALNPDGTFTYTPTVGYSGIDAFTYTIKNSADATLTDTGTVTITVTNPVWYVNNAGGGGNGTSTAPFSTLASLNAAGGSGDSDGVNDVIYVYKGAGAYTGGLPLENGQRLIAENTALIVSGITLRAAVPANTPTLTHTTGSTVTLAVDNTISGFNITNSNGHGISGAAIGTATLSDLTIATANGIALNATGSGTLAVTGSANTLTATNHSALNVQNVTIAASGLTFRSISSSGGTASGIILENTGALGGLTVTGDGTNTTKGGNASGGTIANKDDAGIDGSGTVGTGIYLNNTANVTLLRMQLNDLKNSGVRGLNVTKFTLQYSTISGANGDSVSGSEGCLAFGASNPGGVNGLLGTGASASIIDNCKFSGGIEHNLEFYGQSDAFALTISNSDVKSNSAAFGSDGIQLELQGTATATVTVQNCAFDNNKSQALQAAANDMSSLDLTVTGNTVANTTQGNEGFVLSNGASGRLTARVTNNTISGILGAAIYVGQTAGNATNASNLSALIQGNTIHHGDATHYGLNRAIIAFFSSTVGQQAPGNVKIDNNTVNSFSDPVNGLSEPIFVHTPDAGTTPRFTATVSNNLVTIVDPAKTSLRGITAQATQGSLGTFDVRANTVNYTAGAPVGVSGVRVRQAGTATAQLARGSASLATPVATVLATNNPAATTEVLGTVTVVENGTFTPPTLLLAAAPAENTSAPVPLSTASSPVPAMAETAEVARGPLGALTQAQLDATVAIAIARWAQAGLSADELARLRALSFEIAALPERRLGEADGHRIRVSATAGAQPWFVDAADARALPGDRVDLLTAILHEMGHALGLDDTYLPAERGALMYGFLTPGERRLPTSSDTQAAAKSDGSVRTRAHFLSAPLVIGALPAGKTVTVKYQVTIAAAVTSITNQGTVSGSNFISVLTDDPTVVGAADATVTPVELPPVVSTLTASLNEDTTLTFSAAIFDARYSDPNSDPLATVRITSLPANGTLKLSGSAFTVPQDIARASLGALTYVPNADYNGSDSFTWNASDSTLFATSAAAANLTINPVNDAPVLSSVSTTAAYTENAAPVVLASSLALTDVDSTTMAGAAVAIDAGGFTGDTLAATTTSTAITANYDSTTRILTLSGVDTIAHYQTVLRSVTYVSSSENPTNNGTNPTRTISWLVNDGAGANNFSATHTTTLTITAVNDAPTVTAASGSLVGLPNVAVTVSGITFADPDAGNASVVATFTVTTGTLSATSGGGVTVGGTPTARTLTGSLANLNAFILAGSLTCTTPTSTTLTIAIDDQGNTGGAALTASTSVSIIVNESPVVTTSGGTTAFTEGDNVTSVPVVIDSGLTVSDADDATLASATVSITGNFQSGQDVLAFDNNDIALFDNIASSYNASTGVLTLTSSGATATLAQWQAALRAVTYTNSSETPDTATRTITFTAHDGTTSSTAATKSVSVTSVNDAPAATVPATLAVTEDTATALTGISFSDADAGSAPVVATFSVPSGTLAATSGSGVTVTGSGTGTLTLTGTIANLNAFIAASNVSFTTAANATSDVTLTVSINDGGNTGTGGAKTASGTTQLQVTAVNDAPAITAPGSISVTEDVSGALTGISFSDVDAGNASVVATLSVPSGTLAATSGSGVTVAGSSTGTLTLTGSIANLNAFIAASNVTFTTALNATSDVTLTVSINDGGNTGTGGPLSASTTVTLSVTAVNDAPVNTVPGAQSTDQNVTKVFSTGQGNAISVSDVDAGANPIRVTLTATNGQITLSGITGLVFSVGSGTSDSTMTFDGTIADINAALNGLTFKPTPGYNGSASLQITTSDNGNTGTGGAKTDTDTIAITINPINPVVTSLSATNPDGTYKLGDTLSLTLTFDQVVTVNTAGGTPTLLLETGATDRNATYVSGSGTNTLTFSYTVQAGDVSADLDYQSTSALALNGATIRNATNDAAILTLPALGGANSIAGQKALVIDGIVPVVASVAVPANGTYATGQNLTLTVNFSESVVVDTTGGTPSLAVTLDTGGTVAASYLSGSGTSSLVFRYTIVVGNNDPDGIALGAALTLNGGTIRDAAGNNAVLTLNSIGSTTAVLVDAIAPTVASIDRVSTTPTKATSLSFTVTFSEAVTGVDAADFSLTTTGTAAGTIDTVTPVSGAIYTVTLSGVTGDGTLRLDLKTTGTGITDVPGNAIAGGFTAGQLYTIDNTAPVITSPAAASATYGSGFGYTIVADETATFNAAGLPAGLALTGGGVINGAPSQTGTFSILLSATDAAGNTGTRTLLLTVGQANSGVVWSAPSGLVYGEALGQAQLNAVAFVAGRFTYAPAGGTILPVGTHTLIATFTPDDSGYRPNSATVTITVAKAPLTVTADSKNRAYGEANPALSATITGFVNGETLATSGVTGAAALSTAATVTTPAGSVAITPALGSLAAANYRFTFVDGVLTIARVAQSITFSAPAEVVVGTPVALAATASSGLPVTFSIVSGDATLNGSTLTANTVAPVVIRASQAGNDNFAPAPDVLRTLAVAAPVRTDRLVNLSSRARIGTAPASTLITGFVIGGSAEKRVLLRAIGPALVNFGLTSVAPNPRLQVYDATGRLILENDDWTGADTAATFTQVGAFSLPPGGRDAALVASLAPGAYTMHVLDGVPSGIALAEIYDAGASAPTEPQRLVNLSTRGTVDAGDGVLIGGFVVTGNAPKRILVRGIGPGLSAFGVANVLGDPRLRVFKDRTIIGENDNWSANAAETPVLTATMRAVAAFALVPGSRDAAILLTLEPGAYTAQVSATDNATGVALVEIYEIPE